MLWGPAAAWLGWGGAGGGEAALVQCQQHDLVACKARGKAGVASLACVQHGRCELHVRNAPGLGCIKMVLGQSQ